MTGWTETFFRPDEIERERITMPAALYNLCRLMLSRCNYTHMYVPVRSLQIQAIIDEEEVIFVDGQGYMVKDGEGGKVIKLSWLFHHDDRGDDLNAPAPIEMVLYAEDSRELHTRLITEFRLALEQIEERMAHVDGGKATVLPFKA